MSLNHIIRCIYVFFPFLEGKLLIHSKYNNEYMSRLYGSILHQQAIGSYHQGIYTKEMFGMRKMNET